MLDLFGLLCFVMDLESKGGYACFTSTPVGIFQFLGTSTVCHGHILAFKSFHLTALLFPPSKNPSCSGNILQTFSKANLQLETPMYDVKHAEKHSHLIGALSNDDAPNLNH